MNKYLLMTSVAIMTLGIASESWADCGTKVTGDGSVGTNAAGNKCGVCGSTFGHESDCQWEIKDGVLTITPAIDSTTGKPLTGVTMADFYSTTPGTDEANGYTSKSSSTAPWARQGATSVVVENGISNIGNAAFEGDTKITSVSGMGNVTSIGRSVFSDATSLQSVDMPNVTSIGNYAFAYASSLQSVDIPNVETIGYGAFMRASSLSYAGLNPNISSDDIGSSAFSGTKVNGCGTGSNSANCNYCTNSYVYGNSASSNISNGTTIYQPSTTGNTGSCVATCAGGYTASNGLCKKNQVQNTQQQGGQGSGQQVSQDSGGSQGSGSATSAADCAASGKYWQEGRCVSSCGASFKLNNGWCDRQRYTPAEAAKVLKNDNTNEVTITFKK